MKELTGKDNNTHLNFQSLFSHLQAFLMCLQQCSFPTGPTNPPGLLAQDRCSCGTSCWSCWGVARAAPLVGEGSGASSSSGTPRNLPGCGGRERASRTWTTTSSAGRSGDAKCTNEFNMFILNLYNTLINTCWFHFFSGECVKSFSSVHHLPLANALSTMYSSPTYVLKLKFQIQNIHRCNTRYLGSTFISSALQEHECIQQMYSLTYTLRNTHRVQSDIGNILLPDTTTTNASCTRPKGKDSPTSLTSANSSSSTIQDPCQHPATRSSQHHYSSYHSSTLKDYTFFENWLLSYFTFYIKFTNASFTVSFRFAKAEISSIFQNLM